VSNVRKRANVGDAEKLKGLIINAKSSLSKEQEALIRIIQKLNKLFIIKSIVLRIVRSKVRVPYPLGVVAFWVSVLGKWFGLLHGGWSQRVVEYPWVLRQLRVFVPRGARVLDVGCSESVLNHVLLYMGYEV